MPLGPMGHVYEWKEVAAYLSNSRNPIFGAAAVPLTDSGKGKTVLLYKAVTEVLGSFPIHSQTIGDCVSHGFGLAIDVLKCVEIAAGESEEFVAETATEAIYAFSRVEVGKGQLGNSDGSVGAWASQAVKEGGTLLRQKYDAIDLTTYSGQLAKEWGNRGKGVPDSLEQTMREHPVNSASLVQTYEEARDANANGYPVPVCSNQGFEDRRDNEGFARPSGQWSHCMCFIAVDDNPRRPALLCMNSWGPDWISGPKRLDQPEGSFWVDAEVADKMLSRNADSYALSGYEGFPARDLNLMI